MSSTKLRCSWMRQRAICVLRNGASVGSQCLLAGQSSLRMDHTWCPCVDVGLHVPSPPPLSSLKTLTSLNKEVRPFFLSDNSIWSLPSVSSLSDYGIPKSWRLFYPSDHSIDLRPVIFGAEGSDSVSKIAFRSCGCFRLISGKTIMVWKGPGSPKRIAIIAVLRSHVSPLFLLLGRDLCGNRILRSCLQKGHATALANYVPLPLLASSCSASIFSVNLLFTMGPKMIAHTEFYYWGINSQLRRPSVTQEFLGGILLCNLGAFIRYFLRTCQLHNNCLGVNFPIAHTSATQKNCFRILCNHVGPHTRKGDFPERVLVYSSVLSVSLLQ